jgi:hypothetical protein
MLSALPLTDMSWRLTAAEDFQSKLSADIAASAMRQKDFVTNVWHSW